MRRIKSRKKLEKPVILDQWIEITRVDGQTVAAFYPSNAELEQERRDMEPQPSLVYRRLNFVNGVPDEYMWTNPPLSVKERGGYFLHRVLIEDWPGILAHEKLTGNKQVHPTLRPQERPEAFGPCPCADCQSLSAHPERL